MSTLTLEPAFQYAFGRQCATVSLTQRHEPCWTGVVATFMCRSKLALSATGRSKVTITGMPMPTVSPCSGGHRRIGLLVEAERLGGERRDVLDLLAVAVLGRGPDPVAHPRLETARRHPAGAVRADLARDLAGLGADHDVGDPAVLGSHLDHLVDPDAGGLVGHVGGQHRRGGGRSGGLVVGPSAGLRREAGAVARGGQDGHRREDGGGAQHARATGSGGEGHRERVTAGTRKTRDDARRRCHTRV
jgi:hypothetical protein